MGDKRRELQVAKVKLFKPQTDNVNSGLTTGGFIVVGGQDLSFCVGLKAPFTSKSMSEEEETFGKTPQWLDEQGNVQKYQSERVIILGPDECQ